jgi:transcriptional regulator with GAF, ATPase, and Fis domain
MTTITAGMQQFGVPSSPDGARRGGTSAGLVLLYSPDFDKLLPAYLLTTHQVYLGRDPSCAICVPERAVSRKHAVVAYEGDHWLVRDLGGSNGTMVDGRFVQEMELEHQHELRIGDTVFKFVQTGAEQFAGFRIDGQMVGGATRRSTTLTELVGGSQIDRIGAQLERIAPVELSVIIQGESGTGKEVVARELHRLSKRRGPFQAVNCAAIPANLIESELFGYKRGAFSGADRDKLGIVAAAHTGTLLLDEIGDMPMEAQAKLLRVLQAREVYPVGATAGQKIDVRVVCATNRDLGRLVKEGRFRGDLLARLNEFHLALPPLRDRKEDIYLLSRTLLERNNFGHMKITFPFMTALVHYDWPYNVRELEACLKRAAALAEADNLEAKHLPETVREVMSSYGSRYVEEPVPPHNPSAPPGEGAAPPRRRGQAPSEGELRALLAQHHGNVAAVGRELGKERMQIHRWMQRFGIVVDEYRS